eukprot:TRINITY_DN13351_c0_g1_i6.p2 TRINITY_DN13351_c0_g1~~TRINITY_DN13351_c0_g1_i6.p2  ORF type:complete len:369 (-),score=56.17 TRINITY_DN13351_c0_g1_i6:245-1351(-)
MSFGVTCANTSFTRKCPHRNVNRLQIRKRRYSITKSQYDDEDLLTREKRRSMENELRDPKYFLDYFFPRPIRITLFGFSAFSCLIGTFLTLSAVIKDQAFAIEDGLVQNVGINLFGVVLFTALFFIDRRAGETRVEQRKKLRDAQIAFGDREVYTNTSGEKMSKLKEVDDDWIIRRLERWGQKDNMPFLGPKKAVILQDLLKEKQPKLAVEVGTMCGYSAIIIGQVLNEDSKLISMETDWKWALAAKRFLWQASRGQKDSKIGNKVEVQIGDARNLIPKIDQKIDFLFLDGVPKEYLEYLKAAEPMLAPGAVVVADNAGVFQQGGLKTYLQYVRYGDKYDSRFIESTFEWRDDIPDGMEVSVFKQQQE